MNPFDEQEQKILLDASVLQAEIKLKKLYTWHDIESVKEECENKLSNADGTAADTYEALQIERGRFHWFEFWLGVGIAFVFAALIEIIIHNL